MSLQPPVPGLRRIGYDARSAAKVQLVVQPGDELVVSDDVAAQLQQASPQFKDLDAAPLEAVAVVEAPPSAKPARKRAAKPKE